MKKYFFLLFLTIGLMACSTAPPPADIAACDKIAFVQDVEETNTAAVTFAAVPEVTGIGNSQPVIYQASLLGDLLGNNIDIIAIVLLVFTTIFGGLWVTLRHKLKQIGDLFLKAYEYTDDKKLDAEERADLKRRFLDIITKSPTSFITVNQNPNWSGFRIRPKT
jgi:hypothetical protein